MSKRTVINSKEDCLDLAERIRDYANSDNFSSFCFCTLSNKSTKESLIKLGRFIKSFEDNAK